MISTSIRRKGASWDVPISDRPTNDSEGIALGTDLEWERLGGVHLQNTKAKSGSSVLRGTDTRPDVRTHGIVSHVAPKIAVYMNTKNAAAPPYCEAFSG